MPSSGLYTSLLHKWIAESIFFVAKYFRVERIFLPAEGHAWERHLIYLCRTGIEYTPSVEGLIHPFLQCRSIFSIDSIAPSFYRYHKLYVRNKHELSWIRECPSEHIVLPTFNQVKCVDNSSNKIFDLLLLPERSFGQVLAFYFLSLKIKLLQIPLRISIRLHPDTGAVAKVLYKCLSILTFTYLSHNKDLDQDINSSAHFLVQGTSALLNYEIDAGRVLVYQPKKSLNTSPYWTDSRFKTYSDASSILRKIQSVDVV